MAISKTGEYTSTVKVGTTLQKLLLGLSILSLLVIIGVQLYTAPKTTTIDDKHWACRESEPVGISAECTLLAKKKSIIRTE